MKRIKKTAQKEFSAPKRPMQGSNRRLAQECAELDPAEERELSEEGLRFRNEEIVLTERNLLALLCGGGSGAKLRDEVMARLRRYAFQRVEHQVLFDCLKAMPLYRPEVVRELLPARLVRAGFPDFDLTPFFEASERSKEEVRMMVRMLTEDV